MHLDDRFPAAAVEMLDADLGAVVRRSRGTESSAHEREWEGETEPFHRKHGRR